nr:synaptic defective enhancer 1-like [Rattus norvegicus]
MLTVGDAEKQVWGQWLLSSPGEQWSSSGRSETPPPPPFAPPPQSPGGAGVCLRSPDLGAPVPGRVTTASRPTSSVPIGCKSPLQRNGWGFPARAGERRPLPPAPERRQHPARPPRTKSYFGAWLASHLQPPPPHPSPTPPLHSSPRFCFLSSKTVDPLPRIPP